MALLACAATAAAQQPEPDSRALGELVQALKQDPRGPFQAIRWFCPDSSVLLPRERCADPGGLQHGLLKGSVSALHSRGLFLGQILAGLDPERAWADADPLSRLRQYQLERFLRTRDDGWIFRRARYYRGAVQAEDEEEWSRRFLVWLVSRKDLLATHFFQIREAARDLPRSASPDLAVRVRAVARTVAEAYPEFGELRVKIHGQPELTDAVRVEEFRRRHLGRTTASIDAQLAALSADIRELFATSTLDGLARWRGSARGLESVTSALERALRLSGAPPALQGEALSGLLLAIRTQLAWASPEQRLPLLDLSLAAERVLFASASAWRPASLRERLQQIHVLTAAAAGSGFLELWEWRAEGLRPPDGSSIPVEELMVRAQQAQRAVAWGSEMVRVTYEPVVERWAAFEPLARGFIDDRTRASILLVQGAAAAELAALAAREAGLANRALDLQHPERLRGLNPGLARGVLEVLEEPTEGTELAPDRIYALLRPPAEMKPVAGILSVSAGNAVSHVQLLARNLGIPNAVLSEEDLRELARHDGLEVLYAVSPRGSVHLKPAPEMSPEERLLVSAQTLAETRLQVPTDGLDLEIREVLDMRTLGAEDSGRICGPKAANLGVLSRLFPDAVPRGVVIPFGVYRAHLEQPLPGGEGSYWDAVDRVFSGPPDAVAAGLAGLREAIRGIPFLPGFEAELRARFREAVGTPVGEISVFIRSDTNMEDLEGFTGAGLNLTVPNVRAEAEVLQAIRDVWASPFGERAYLWRQRVLVNPEAVYPSIVILPSIEVELSGVMITAGVAAGGPGDVTVAFNWGGTGAVAGQSAETWLLQDDGRDRLLAPARDAFFTRLLPGGGLARVPASFERPILDLGARRDLRRIAARVRDELPGTPGLLRGPYDVELGFWNGHPWLFQVRPFVERREGRTAAYLRTLDAPVPAGLKLPLDAPPE
jgi:hypothetical protein